MCECHSEPRYGADFERNGDNLSQTSTLGRASGWSAKGDAFLVRKVSQAYCFVIAVIVLFFGMSALPLLASIALLPFNNMSGDPEQEYFTDGVTEDIITELSRFHSLFVIARNSSFTYKGKAVDVRTVSRELGVRYVLEGSIRRSGNRIRVTAQLIDALSGNHIWAEKYDRVLEDIFAVQEEVTECIVAAIAPRIDSSPRTGGPRRRPLQRHPEVPIEIVVGDALESVALTQQRLHALAQAGLDGRDAAGIAAAKHDDVITALGQCVTQIIHQLQDAAFADELFAKG